MRRRCLIPATGFFEWRKRPDGKQPYRILPQGPAALRNRRLWEFARIGGGEILSAAIIVGEANELVPLHDRMPLILEPADYDAWLDPATPVGRTASAPAAFRQISLTASP